MSLSRWKLACLSLALLAPACLRFEHQTILASLNRESDVLHLRLIDQGVFKDAAGLFMGTEPAPDLEEGLRELAALDHEIRFLLDWVPLSMDEARKSAEEGEESARLFVDHVRLLDHGLFVNAGGRLCAWQDVRVERFQEFLGAVNGLLSLALTDESASWGDLDPSIIALNRERAAAGHEWIRWDEEEGLVLSLFAPPEQWEALKKEALEDLLAAASPQAQAEAERSESRTLLVNVLSQNPLSWIHRGEEVRIALAPRADGVVVLEWWNTLGYEPELLDAVRAGDYPDGVVLALDADASVEALVAAWPPPQ